MAGKKSDKGSEKKDEPQEKVGKSGRPVTPTVKRGEKTPSAFGLMLRKLAGWGTVVLVVALAIGLAKFSQRPSIEYLGLDRPTDKAMPVVFEKAMRVSLADSVFWSPHFKVQKGDVLTVAGNPCAAQCVLDLSQNKDLSTAGLNVSVDRLPFRSDRDQYLVKGKVPIAGLVGIVGEKHRKPDGFYIVDGGSDYFFLGERQTSIAIPCDGNLYFTLNEPLTRAAREDDKGLWVFTVKIQRPSAPTASK